MVSPQNCGLYLGLQSAVGYFMTIIAPLAFGAILQACNGLVSQSMLHLGSVFYDPGFGWIIVPTVVLANDIHR